ncbi:hypothetical protein [Nocardia cyriacigeorgica]|uniref:hypothetical protein n=1 Tax=Nocardia cyriacigeorgica TaxID=135487 RepID=UPI001895DF0A|nr:hypothetical protein [Nocardia cyriacigeorgica]MBF6440327.1 hypothetical protein [Nocardia cyriacigeorgica]MBF6457133.1 hypothetical protein [Nocardia cyriacigeorgica]MBF6479085.1 hypothetical protein [Nocardia cyriacigeorgica]MBF6554206.1 hypothetical protein [Nocardia cyriacigeorgica]
MRTAALRAIPVIGWLYLVAGLIAASAGRAPAHRLPRALWWIDAFLSVVVHAAQIPFALRAARGSGRSAGEIALMTQIFGLTWWRTIDHGQREDTR